MGEKLESQSEQFRHYKPKSIISNKSKRLGIQNEKKTCFLNLKFRSLLVGPQRAHALDNTDAGREDQKHQLHAALTLAVTNSAQRSCTLCQKPGATLRCAFCSKAYHYGCALHECCYMDHMEPYKFTCRAHSARITDVRTNAVE